MSTNDHPSTPAEFRAIEDAFLHAWRLDPQHRSAYLEARFADRPDLVARVNALLAHDHTADCFSDEVEREAARLLATTSSRPAVDGYQILEELGRGGMAVVWSAEQQQPHRIVALKVLAPQYEEPEHLARLLREADVLARLEHPHIARLYAVGHTVDGRPFFAMEWIAGQRLDAFVRDRRPDLRERLRILLQVASAIEHAHQRGVIHRDLKPSNVLVDEAGVPKVVDFGIAWLVESLSRVEDSPTATTDRSGTLPYMSPEQRLGDLTRIDTRTDVYGLGALAYELLGGKAPYEISGMSTSAAMRALETSQPLPVSHHDPRLRGDLEAILAKAMEPEPARRYGSVSQFADDVRRHLALEPVAARDRQLAYVLGRFLRRNRRGVLALTLALLGLVGGLIAALIALSRTHAAEVVARQESVTSQQVARRLVRLLSIADDARLSPNATFDDVLTLAIDWLENDLEFQTQVTPDIRHGIQLAVGEALLAVEQFEPAMPWFGSLAEAGGGEPIDVLTRSAALLGLLRAHLGLDQGDAAADVISRFALVRDDLQTVTRAEVFARAWHIGWLAAKGDLESAESSLAAMQQLAQRTIPEERRALILAAVEYRRADIDLRLGRKAESDHHLSAARQFSLLENGRSPTRRELEFLSSSVLLAPNRSGRGRPAPDRGRMAEQLLAEGRFGEAEAQFRRRLETPAPPMGGARAPRVMTLLRLGRSIAAQDRFDEALVLLRDAVRLTRSGPRGGSMQTVLALAELVELAFAARRFEIVIEESEAAIALSRESRTNHARLLGKLLYWRGGALLERDRPEEALVCLREARPLYESIAEDTAALDAALAKIEGR